MVDETFGANILDAALLGRRISATGIPALFEMASAAEADLRQSRALLLYADRVTAMSLYLELVFSERNPLVWYWALLTKGLWDDDLERLFEADRPSPMRALAPLSARHPEFEKYHEVFRRAHSAAEGMQPALIAGVFRLQSEASITEVPLLPPQDLTNPGDWFADYRDRVDAFWSDWLSNSPWVVPVGEYETPSAGATRRAAEGALAASLVGGLESFPDASVDVLLDVRERLAAPRARLRAAVAEAARDLDDEVDLDEFVAATRRRLLDPAVAGLREELEELGARPTLLRLTESPHMNSTVGGTVGFGMAIALGIGATDILHLVELLFGAGSMSALSKELAFRRQYRRRLTTAPFWVLSEADKRTRPDR
jgi:hypothetical protein